LETELTALAIWDGLYGDGPGGTASAVERWRAIDLPVEIIDLVRLRKEAGTRFRAKDSQTTEPFETELAARETSAPSISFSDHVDVVC
jgi:hypothetical protein